MAEPSLSRGKRHFTPCMTAKDPPTKAMSATHSESDIGVSMTRLREWRRSPLVEEAAEDLSDVSLWTYSSQ